MYIIHVHVRAKTLESLQMSRISIHVGHRQRNPFSYTSFCRHRTSERKTDQPSTGWVAGEREIPEHTIPFQHHRARRLSLVPAVAFDLLILRLPRRVTLLLSSNLVSPQRPRERVHKSLIN